MDNQHHFYSGKVGRSVTSRQGVRDTAGISESQTHIPVLLLFPLSRAAALKMALFPHLRNEIRMAPTLGGMLILRGLCIYGAAGRRSISVASQFCCKK